MATIISSNVRKKANRKNPTTSLPSVAQKTQLKVNIPEIAQACLPKNNCLENFFHLWFQVIHNHNMHQNLPDYFDR
jgi:hypothetical protein